MAEGIVLQLQAEALDENVDIETLLRKAYLVARKLQLRDFENWISLEQNGYKETPPDYRIIGGELQAWNPYQGWIPVVIQGIPDVEFTSEDVMYGLHRKYAYAHVHLFQ